ncbi:MAG: hypothetical protein ACKVZJ_06895 [Phycisphaerales bacterium]
MTVDLARLYQAFEPAPLKPGQQKDLYVDLSAVRGEHEVGGIAKKLAMCMRLSKGPTCQLLTGHRGSGKSTELYRLERELGAGTPKLFAVFCDIDEALNRNDLDFPDLLLAIVRQLAIQVKTKLGIELRKSYFQDRFEELKELLGREVNLETLELGEGMAKVVGTIKASPKAREQVRAMLEPRVDSLLHAANDVIAQTRDALKGKGYSDLVLIVDNTDHLARRDGEGAERFPGENLFIRRYSEVSRFDCHVVYAIPLELAYSVRESEIKRLYGCKTPVVGVTKVRDKNGSPFEMGIDRFREVIRKRVAFAGASMAEVFESDAVRDELILLTGGQPLELCALIRECVLGGLPIRSERLTEVKRQEHRGYARWLQRRHWNIIQQIRAGQQPMPDDSNALALRDLIEGRVILYHMNDEDWLAVSPLVGEPPAQLSESDG